jgi:hypothetical protein
MLSVPDYQAMLQKRLLADVLSRFCRCATEK